MDARKDIEKRIEKEKAKITELQNQIELSQSFIQGLQEALKILPRNGTIQSSRRGSTIREGSDMAKIRDLIRERERPMHIGEIVIGIGRENTKANRMSISGSLGRYVRKNIVFNRPRPNTFSLINMKETTDVEIPSDFGSEEIHTKITDEDLPF
jgi:hypothetical protein